MAWKLGNKLKTLLQNSGITVVMTKTSLDHDPSLSARGAAAAGSDLFISLHSNACGYEYVDYPVVFTSLDNSGGVRTLSQNIINGVKELMGTTQNAQVLTKLYPDSTYLEYYGVLRGAQNAGCVNRLLVEHSFHTNTNACAWLNNDSNLDKLAEMEAKYICSFLGVAYGGGGSVDPDPTPAGSCSVTVGSSITVNNVALYADSYAGTYARQISGTYTVTRVIEGREAGILLDGIGWVKASEVTGDCKIVAGCTVSLNNAALYSDSYGSNYARQISGTYTVDRVIDGREAGVLIGGGIGWVKESECTRV